ncbi:hypothetical protein HK104_007761, partial [Borealophlyctis nickersoniae]
MDVMYGRALSSAFEGEGDDDEDWSENFRLVLGAIVTVPVPIDVGTLSHLLELDEDTVENTLGRIASLLYIADDQVRVVHKSFADFLTDPKRCTDPRFQIDQTVHNQRLSSCCLRALKDDLKSNMCSIAVTQLNSEVADLQQRIQKNIPGHLRYASRYWIDHLTSAPHTPELLTELDELLTRQLLNWLEVISVMNLVPVMTMELQELHVWLKSDPVSSAVSPTTTHLVHDVSRFIREFGVPIAMSAPHVRASAAPFCPAETTLYRTYAHQLDVEVIKGRDAGWSACIQTLEGHTGDVRSVAVTPDGLMVVTGSYDKTAKVWDARTGSLLQTLEGHIRDVNSVAVTPDRQTVVTGSEDETAK